MSSPRGTVSSMRTFFDRDAIKPRDEGVNHKEANEVCKQPPKSGFGGCSIEWPPSSQPGDCLSSPNLLMDISSNRLRAVDFGLFVLSTCSDGRMGMGSVGPLGLAADQTRRRRSAAPAMGRGRVCNLRLRFLRNLGWIQPTPGADRIEARCFPFREPYD
jgi:hypothetical protein